MLAILDIKYCIAMVTALIIKCDYKNTNYPPAVIASLRLDADRMQIRYTIFTY